MGDMGQTAIGVLEAVFAKAIANGWQSSYAVIFKEFPRLSSTFVEASSEYYQIIFDHKFAKALWGDTPELESGITRDAYITEWANEHTSYGWRGASDIAARDWAYFDKQGKVLPAYLWRLKEMVTYIDPITYLAKYSN